MPIRLPGAEDFGGGVPSGRSGKAIASYDTSSIGEGFARLGGGLAQAGGELREAAAVRKASVDKRTQFETESRYLEFAAQQEKALQESSQRTAPGAFGFRELYQSDYLKAAKEFMATVPEELKPAYDVKLFQTEDSLTARATAFERESRKGYYTNKVNDGLTMIEGKLYKSPSSFAGALAEGDAYIDSLPDEDVSPSAKEELRRAWRTKAQLASLNGMTPTDRLASLGVAPNAANPLPADVQGRANRVRDRLVTKGWSPEQAAGVAGHLVQESGVRADGPAGDNGSAHGMGQWRGARFTKLQRFAAAQGKDWRDFDTQVDFIDLELREDERTAFDALKRATTVDQAVEAFMHFERPQGYSAGNPRGGHGFANRLAAAQRTAGVEVAVPQGAVDPRFADMPYIDREKVAAAAASDIGQQAEKDRVQAAAAYKIADDAVALGIETGRIKSEAEILADPSLDAGDIAKHLRSFRAKQKDTADVSALISAITSGDKTAAAVNPFDADERKTGNKAYDAMMKAVPPEQAEAVTEAYVQSTGFIPDDVQAVVRQGAASNDPAALSAALSQADHLERIAPISFGAIEGGSSVRDKLAVYRHSVNDLGMSGEQAAQRIISASDPAVKANRAVLEKEADKFVKDLTVADVTNAFDTSILWGGEPGAGVMPLQTNGLLAEYREIAAEKFYQAGGNADNAKAMAIAELKTRWNVSNISGSPNLMRLPPELHYPPIGGSFDYLRTDAMATAQEYAKSTHPERTVTNVAIMPAAATRGDIDAGRPARYRLFYQYDNGGLPAFEEVTTPDGLWGVDPRVVKATDEAARGFTGERQSSEKLAKDRRDRNAVMDSILSDPSQPDWLKAMRATSAGEAATMKQGKGNRDSGRAPVAEDDPLLKPVTKFGGAL